MRRVKARCPIIMKPSFCPCVFFHSFNLMRGYARTTGYKNHDKYANLFEYSALMTIIQKELDSMYVPKSRSYRISFIFLFTTR